jgi:replicative DNA helicase
MILSQKEPIGKKLRRYLDSISDLYEKLAPGGLVPPQVVEFEQSMLGAMMIDKASAMRCIEIVGQIEPETSPFYREAHTAIYCAALTLTTKGEPIDLLTITHQLRSDGKLEEIGGPSYLVELTTQVVTTVNADSHARIILEKHAARELIRICEETKLRAFEQETDVFELAAELDSQASNLLNIRHSGSAKFRPIKDVSVETMRLMDRAGKPEGQGLSFGLTELNEITAGGSRPGDLIILGGRTGQGKTALAGTFARAASGPGASTAIFSLEMTGPKLVMRLLCGEAGVSLQRARRGWLNDEEWKKITEAHSRLSEAGIHLFDGRHVTQSSIRSSAMHLATRLANTDKPLKRIILDYIAIPELPGKTKESIEIGALAYSLRDLARELGTDMIALSQITRDAAKRKPPRPALADIAESGTLEEAADIVLLAYRPETYQIHADEAYLMRTGSPSTAGLAEIIVAKNREGETGTCIAKFIGDRARFEDWPSVVPKESPVAPEPIDEILF